MKGALLQRGCDLTRMPVRIFRAWREWRPHWEDLCTRCGKCCYGRHVTSSGYVIIHYSSPCEHLDRETNLCTVYQERFQKCSHCRKVNLWTALTNPTLPNDCPYRTTFRLWEPRRGS